MRSDMSTCDFRRFSGVGQKLELAPGERVSRSEGRKNENELLQKYFAINSYKALYAENI